MVGYSWQTLWEKIQIYDCFLSILKSGAPPPSFHQLKRREWAPHFKNCFAGLNVCSATSHYYRQISLKKHETKIIQFFCRRSELQSMLLNARNNSYTIAVRRTWCCEPYSGYSTGYGMTCHSNIYHRIVNTKNNT